MNQFTDLNELHSQLLFCLNVRAFIFQFSSRTDAVLHIVCYTLIFIELSVSDNVFVLLYYSETLFVVVETMFLSALLPTSALVYEGCKYQRTSVYPTITNLYLIQKINIST